VPAKCNSSVTVIDERLLNAFILYIVFWSVYRFRIDGECELNKYFTPAAMPLFQMKFFWVSFSMRNWSRRFRDPRYFPLILGKIAILAEYRASLKIQSFKQNEARTKNGDAAYI